jgi:hypothetical protein
MLEFWVGPLVFFQTEAWPLSIFFISNDARNYYKLHPVYDRVESYGE